MCVCVYVCVRVCTMIRQEEEQPTCGVYQHMTHLIMSVPKKREDQHFFPYAIKSTLGTITIKQI